MSLIIYELGDLTFPDYSTSELPTLSNIKKGDTVNFIATIVDSNGDAIDATNWLIRAEMYDDLHSIKKGSDLVSGGASSQAEWTSALDGVFKIYFGASETNIFNSTVNFEIEIETTDVERLTIYQSIIQFSDARIDWDDVS
jgi:hypothetical protein